MLYYLIWLAPLLRNAKFTYCHLSMYFATYAVYQLFPVPFTIQQYYVILKSHCVLIHLIKFAK